MVLFEKRAYRAGRLILPKGVRKGIRLVLSPLESRTAVKIPTGSDCVVANGVVANRNGLPDTWTGFHQSKSAKTIPESEIPSGTEEAVCLPGHG